MKLCNLIHCGNRPWVCGDPFGHEGNHHDKTTGEWWFQESGKQAPDETEQPPPQPSIHPDVFQMACEAAFRQIAKGEAKYGQRLKPFDGRDNLKDLQQELWDAFMYVTKEIYERDYKNASK